MTGSDSLRDRVCQEHQRRFWAGDVLCAEGERPALLFVVAEGEVELRRDAPGGPRLLQRVGPGGVIGAAALFGAGRQRGSAVAVTEGRALVLDHPTCHAMCAEAPEIAARLLAAVAREADASAQRLADLDGDDSLALLSRALLRTSEPGGAGARVPGRLLDIAATAGLTPFETYRALQRLLDRRLLLLEGDELQIPAPELLAACVVDHAI